MFADEMRLGLHGVRRRVWYGKGVRLRQRLERRFVWKWLYLAVDAVQGKLWWSWRDNLKQDSVEAALLEWGEAGVARVVWDNAPSHRAKALRDEEKRLPAVHFLPPFSPELNVAERVFLEVRRCVEGRIWETLEAKEAAVEAFLKELSADAERLRRLVCWQWIEQACQSLPIP